VKIVNFAMKSIAQKIYLIALIPINLPIHSFYLIHLFVPLAETVITQLKASFAMNAWTPIRILIVIMLNIAPT